MLLSILISGRAWQGWIHMYYVPLLKSRIFGFRDSLKGVKFNINRKWRAILALLILSWFTLYLFARRVVQTEAYSYFNSRAGVITQGNCGVS